MTSVRKTLLAVFCIPVLLCLLMVLLYETELLEPGISGAGGVKEYYWVGAMELVTICTIPLALRLLKFGFVCRAIVAAPESGLKRWGICRLLMIGVPMMVNTFLYYQFMNVAFGYMAIIGLLSLAFVYPSETRCQQEMKTAD